MYNIQQTALKVGYIYVKKCTCIYKECFLKFQLMFLVWLYLNYSFFLLLDYGKLIFAIWNRIVFLKPHYIESIYLRNWGTIQNIKRSTHFFLIELHCTTQDYILNVISYLTKQVWLWLNISTSAKMLFLYIILLFQKFST